ncbi:MAG TPA: glycosyltransferase family 1 protein [Dehalococcoidia bacterium]
MTAGPPRPLRVCLDARLISGVYGGVEQVAISLAAGLSALEDGNEEYLFLTYAGEDAWLRPYLAGRCRLLSGPPPPAPGRWKAALKAAAPPLRRAWHHLGAALIRPDAAVPPSDGTVERAGADVVHFTHQGGFRTAVPSIYHPHDLQHVHLPQYFAPRVRRLREASYGALCRQARLVAVSTSWCREDVIRHFGLPAEKVQVVPLAPALDAYPQPTEGDLAAARERFSLPDAFVLYPAQTWPHKNHLGLLEALALLRRQGLAPPLVCTGHRNEFFPVIQRRARERGLSDQVRFLGYVDPLALQCLYRLARCVVIPTKFEADSAPLWEAFRLGVPAACSAVTSLPRQAGDAALLFDPDQPGEMAAALRRLWLDGGLRRTLAERGRRRAAHLTPDRSARTFRAHYRRLAGRPLTEEDRALLAERPEL